MPATKTIVLIHGNFVNNTSWSEWKKYYEQKGYTVHTPANPGHNGNPADLRKNVHPKLIQTGFIDVVDNLVKLIDSLPEKPLIIGHSMAGMATLKLVELGRAVAGVSIDGAPPKNVFPPFSDPEDRPARIWIFFLRQVLYGKSRMVRLRLLQHITGSREKAVLRKVCCSGKL